MIMLWLWEHRMIKEIERLRLLTDGIMYLWDLHLDLELYWNLELCWHWIRHTGCGEYLSARKRYLSRNEIINIAMLLFLSCSASQDSLLLSRTIFSIFWCKSRQFSVDFQIDCKINFVSLYYTPVYFRIYRMPLFQKFDGIEWFAASCCIWFI